MTVHWGGLVGLRERVEREGTVQRSRVRLGTSRSNGIAVARRPYCKGLN